MLPRINHVFTLAKDPELVHTPNDKTICRLSIVSSEKYKDKETAMFINAVAFGNGGNAIASYFKKGSRIFISGKLAPNNYEKDGRTVYGYQVFIEEFKFVDKKQNDNGRKKHDNQKRNAYVPQEEDMNIEIDYDYIPF